MTQKMFEEVTNGLLYGILIAGAFAVGFETGVSLYDLFVFGAIEPLLIPIPWAPKGLRPVWKGATA